MMTIVWKKIISAAGIFLFSVFPLFSDPMGAVVTDIDGKVETRSSGNDPWQALHIGDELDPGDSISTDFNSSAVLELDNGVVIAAESLTRMTLEELSASEDNTNTELSLKLGNVRAEVKTSKGMKNDFTIRSANSTASVRGTVIDAEILGDGSSMMVFAWNGRAEVRESRTGRTSSVGTPSADDKGSKESEEDSKADESDEKKVKRPPQRPSRGVYSVLTGVPGGGSISPLSMILADAKVSASTKPPGPGFVSLGSGSSINTSAASSSDFQPDSEEDIFSPTPPQNASVTITITGLD
ncbi:MAG: FecR domain-containing protein [Spirochaetia bacterium]|nr:FecR domain-containing protein [Spirochaetia bacterium]MCF7954128.1 FecR domain-containing protein [Spirochaetales bacterium]